MGERGYGEPLSVCRGGVDPIRLRGAARRWPVNPPGVEKTSGGPYSATFPVPLPYRLSLLHLVRESAWKNRLDFWGFRRPVKLKLCTRATDGQPVVNSDDARCMVLQASTPPPPVPTLLHVRLYLHAERGSALPQECDGERISRIDRRVPCVRSRWFRCRVRVEVILIVIDVHCTWVTIPGYSLRWHLTGG